MPKIITGHTGTPHITADDVGALLKSIIGSNDYLLSDTLNTFSATLLENNVVQMPDAEVVMQGTHIRITDSDTVTISQGQSGMKRIDLIVCRYSKADSIESASIAVVTGTPAASNPATPTVTQGDIRGGALLHEMPLFKVELDGFSITSITRFCNNINSIKSIYDAFDGSINSLGQQEQSHFNSAMRSIENLANTLNNKISAINTNNLLWSGAYYMTASHEITIPSVQNQTNGIVLVFCNYSSGAAQDYDWHCFFIPKGLVNRHGGRGHRFNMVGGLFSSFCCKYLYISNTKIKGHDNNNKSGTGSSGVKYDNAKFVLRYVFGV